MESIFTKDVFVAGSFRRIRYNGIPYGFRFSLHSIDTRMLFLSCIEGFRLSLDGDEISPYDIQIRLKDRVFLAAHLPLLAYERWELGDQAVVTVRDYHDLDGEHELSIDCMVRLPFVFDAAHPCVAPVRAQIVTRFACEEE